MAVLVASSSSHETICEFCGARLLFELWRKIEHETYESSLNHFELFVCLFVEQVMRSVFGLSVF